MAKEKKKKKEEREEKEEEVKYLGSLASNCGYGKGFQKVYAIR